MPDMQPRRRCTFCLFPEDVAQLRSDMACCTGCCDTCVCLDRIWYPPRRPGRNRGAVEDTQAHVPR